ncbi:hypothetical protein SAMN06272737_12441 [Blastococcus mobilis]|uniref:Uncharacterized protein n=1 Tax=Blastococcus mobilis TaxID=1938746 RepID=A0A238Z386_9ACTN|nr:hypothetical protein SAMN06272737_12441 [Blastococcus mobilis]
MTGAGVVAGSSEEAPRRPGLGGVGSLRAPTFCAVATGRSVLGVFGGLVESTRDGETGAGVVAGSSEEAPRRPGLGGVGSLPAPTFCAVATGRSVLGVFGGPAESTRDGETGAGVVAGSSEEAPRRPGLGGVGSLGAPTFCAVATGRSVLGVFGGLVESTRAGVAGGLAESTVGGVAGGLAESTAGGVAAAGAATGGAVAPDRSVLGAGRSMSGASARGGFVGDLPAGDAGGPWGA